MWFKYFEKKLYVENNNNKQNGKTFKSTYYKKNIFFLIQTK